MKIRSRQQGYALLIFVAALATASSALAVKVINNNGNNQIARDKITAAALAQAKDALIGYASIYQDANLNVPFYMNGYLPNPDLGPGDSQEGRAAGNFSGNHKDYSAIGKVPWKKLGVTPLRDGQGECLWYVVSGRFKNTPLTDELNWDTQGQIDITDSNGNLIASNVAALLVAPGKPQTGQNRAHDPADTQYIQCGGNYDAGNYLNSYFPGSTNNRVASNTNNKSFVMANNDRFLFVTVDDIFRPIIHRSNFRDQISALLNDPYLQSIASSASKKGTNNINCDNTSNSDNQNFCKNWGIILLLTTLPVPSNITIDGALTPAPCSRVLIFGGQKTAGQVRLTNADKNNPDNYLEAPNRAAFDTPTAHSSNFYGFSTFDAKHPEHDLLRCIP
ncbi:MAG: hypothetical protein WC208_09240 [Gallionella sp.]|jgi:hypothetical protein